MDSHLGVCIYYVLIHCVIYYPVQGKYYSLGNLLDFNSAFKRCQNDGSYLPHVDLRSSIFLLKDFESEGNCFWVQAILISATDNLRNEFPYPEFCCGTLQKNGETLTQSCISCSNTTSYICTSDHNVYKSGSNINASTWVAARDECKAKGGLPLANNTNLQSKLMDWKNGSKSFWIAKIGWIRSFFIQGEEYECGYWCKNEVKFGSCVQEGRNLTTYCVSDRTSTLLTTHPVTSTTPFSTTSSTGTTHANTPSTISTSTSTKTSTTTTPSTGTTTKPFSSTTLPTISDRTSTLLTTNPVTSTTSFSTTSSTGTTHANSSSTISTSTSTKTSTTTTPSTAIYPILGGAAGAFVALVVVIIIIICVRRRRMKKGQDAVLNSSTNNTSPDKVLSQNNLSYDTINGESFAMEGPTAEESVIYAQPQKVMDGKFNIGHATDDLEKHGLYSKVKKEHNTYGISNNHVELGNGESSENVYNKANFHQEETANMYDKADFRLEVLEIGNINDYDKATFHLLENSNYDTGYITNATVDSTYDRLN